MSRLIPVCMLSCLLLVCSSQQRAWNQSPPPCDCASVCTSWPVGAPLDSEYTKFETHTGKGGLQAGICMAASGSGAVLMPSSILLYEDPAVGGVFCPPLEKVCNYTQSTSSGTTAITYARDVVLTGTDATSGAISFTWAGDVVGALQGWFDLCCDAKNTAVVPTNYYIASLGVGTYTSTGWSVLATRSLKQSTEGDCPPNDCGRERQPDIPAPLSVVEFASFSLDWTAGGCAPGDFGVTTWFTARHHVLNNGVHIKDLAETRVYITPETLGCDP